MNDSSYEKQPFEEWQENMVPFKCDFVCVCEVAKCFVINSHGKDPTVT